MSLVTICASLIAALLGLGYPLLLQVMARIEDKYKSDKISAFLRAEISWKLYRWFLFISLTLILFYIIKNIPFITLPNKVGIIISDILLISLIISTSFTVIFFVLFANKILVYNSFSQLSHYLISLDRKVQPTGDYKYFEGLTDILIVTIRDSNILIAREISQYCYNVYHQFLETHIGEPVEYPTPYYNMVLRATEELALSKERSMPFLETRTIGGLWLIGEMREHIIHESTYSCLWGAINIAIKFQRDDFIMHLWERTDQHITYKLSPRLISEFTDDKKEQRERFLEFHYALGGLLLFKRRYQLIGRFFRFTRSQPPQRDLLPLNLDEIFRIFFIIRDPYYREFMKIQSRYSFPDIEGINSDDVIKHWICKYLALLFIRQFSIVPHLITIKPLDPPLLPDTQQKRKMWIENIEYFKGLVEELYGNKEILAQCHLEYITNEWCKKNEKPTPPKLLEEILKKLQADYDLAKITQEISENKKRLFYKYSSEKLVSTMAMYDPINNTTKFKREYKDLFIYGEYMIVDKSAFADDQDVGHLNYYSFLADGIADKYKSGVSEIFYLNASSRYLIKLEDIKSAIDRLHLNKHEHIVIVFGVNEEYYKNLVPTYEKESKLTFGLKTILFPNCNYSLLKRSLFIVSRNNLPNIQHLQIEEQNIKKYNLKELSSERQIFATVTDLYKEKEIRKELSNKNTSDNLEQSVYLLISTNTRFRWKKQMKMAMLKIYSEYGDEGTPVDTKDIKPLSKPQ